MKFQSAYKKMPYLPEANYGLSVTETAGYIPAKQQIENLIYSGERLAQYRRDMYDFGPDDEDDEEFTDPTRAPNFDLADYSAYARELNAKAAAAARKAAVEKSVSEDTAVPESKAESGDDPAG